MLKIQMFISRQLMFQHGSGQLFIKKKEIYLDSENLFTSVMANVIIQLHVMTGCDHNNGFYGRGI